MASEGNKAPAIGIDLGTTYSCVAVWQNNRVEIIPNDQGNRITPSCVAFTEYGRLVGDAAKNQTDMNPINTVFAIKRLIGRRFSDTSVQNDIKHWPFKVVSGPMDKPKIVVNYQGAEKKFYAEEISSMVLMKMKETAETYLNCTVKNAVITVPAYFNNSQRQATKNAGAIAGLNVMRIMDEPTAAAIAYGLDKITEEADEINVLVFDLGGDTFDVSLLTIRHGKFEVRATAGDTHLGGDDFDDRLVDHCVREFKKKYNKDINGNARSLRRLRTACKRAKRTLSFCTPAIIEVAYLYDGIDFTTHISQDRFEELTLDLFTRFTDLIENCLNDAKFDKRMVDVVVLVGGSTRIPKIQQLLQDLFVGKKICKEINPKEVVAYGAAIQAMNFNGQGDKELQNIVLVDVTPLSLGVRMQGERMTVVVPRNTPIPTEKHYVLTTTIDDQTTMALHIYEGESAEIKYNYLLGCFGLYGIDAAPKGIPQIDICFHIDANGIITVSAEDKSSGSMNRIVIGSHITPKEIQSMGGEAVCYKAEQKRKARVSLEDYACKVKAMAKDPGLSASEKKSMEVAAQNAIEWLDRNPQATIDEISERQGGLETTMRRLMKLKRGGIPYDQVLLLSRGT
ncbi:Heat shock 70 kDa protein [Rhynchospora pubera]|uniref:Heat shock 70 kDa protein n=1 Tax=Rhynchospora pubera TaxID=906938 RepID=A0AAV8GDG1_9POAL|nr:Heat shock 70 kDa protein [Rhynchospora pubera]